MKKNIPAILLTLCLLLCLQACKADLQNQSTPQAHPTSQQTTVAKEDTLPPTPTPNPYLEWETYTNELYGFSLFFPPEWEISEELQKTPEGYPFYLLELDAENSRLMIHFASAAQALQKDGIISGRGEIKDFQTLTFAGSEKNSRILQTGDSIQAVFLGEPGEVFKTGSLYFSVFILSEGSGIPAEEVLQGLKVLESLADLPAADQAVPPYAGWEQYKNTGYGLEFWYPSDWTLNETFFGEGNSRIPLIEIKKDNTVLNIEYWLTENYVFHYRPLKSGILQDAESIYLLGQKTPRLQMLLEDEKKAVFYNGLEDIQAGSLSLRIYLNNSGSLLNYINYEVPVDLQDAAEKILQTLQIDEAENTPAAVEILSQGSDRFLTFKGCFDLDEGSQTTLPEEGEENTCDFTVSAVTPDSLNIHFSPLAPSVFGFGGVFSEEPGISQCIQSENLKTQAETIAPLTTHYVCFQTDEGHYGYILFKGMTSDGVTFSWKTYDIAGPLQQEAAAGNAATFQADVNIPDGTVFSPGETFTKTWRILNTGETTWEEDYAVRFAGGYRMDAPFEIYLPHQVKPGGLVNISIDFTAPPIPGEYESHWIFRDKNGNPFGLGKNGDLTFYTSIIVENDADLLPEGAAASEDSPVLYASLEVKQNEEQASCPRWLTLQGEIYSRGSSGFSYRINGESEDPQQKFLLPPAENIIFGSSALNQVEYEYFIYVTSETQGWLQLEVTSPGSFSSEKIPVQIICE